MRPKRKRRRARRIAFIAALALSAWGWFGVSSQDKTDAWRFDQLAEEWQRSPEFRAITIRSEALNELHGNAVTRLSPRVFVGLYQAGANRMTPQEFAALVARSEALNSRYGLGR